MRKQAKVIVKAEQANGGFNLAVKCSISDKPYTRATYDGLFCEKPCQCERSVVQHNLFHSMFQMLTGKPKRSL